MPAMVALCVVPPLLGGITVEPLVSHVGHSHVRLVSVVRFFVIG